MIPKLQILLGKGKVTFSNNNKKENIFGFKFPARRHLGFHDVTALSYCFKQKKVSFPTLSPGQTIATCQPNISQHCWAQHVACVWPPCCDMLRGVECCWLKFDHFQTWANNTQHVATHRNTVAKRTQHVVPNNVGICCVGMLRSFGRGLRLTQQRKYTFAMKKSMRAKSSCLADVKLGQKTLKFLIS